MARLVSSVKCCMLLLLTLLIKSVQLNASDELCLDKDKQILELQLENSRIKLENLNLREQNKRLLNERINCTTLADEAVYISEILKRIQLDVQPFKNFIQSKFGTQMNKTNDEHEEWSEKVSEILSIVKKTEAANKSSTDENSQSKQKVTKSVKTYKNCAEAADGKVGVFRIQVPNSIQESFEAACDNDNWMIILRRIDGSVDFYRNWREYREGFGNASGEYFVGLEKLHQLTSRECHELKIELEDFENHKRFSKYNRFEIANEYKLYELSVLGEYYGTAGDALNVSRSMKFSTHDRDNDGEIWNCVSKFGGAWWHNSCAANQLTGVYLPEGINRDGNGIEWYTWRFPYSYKTAKMLIRPCKCLKYYKKVKHQF